MRNWTGRIVFSAVLAASSVYVAVAVASDHADSPATVADKQLDIADVFAFMRPEPAGGGFAASTHMVLAMTVEPNATAASKFYPGAEYTFQIMRLADDLSSDTPYTVVCQATDKDAGGQAIYCSAAGFSAVATVGAAPGGAPGDKVRVWAGLRSDPAFFDKAKFTATASAGALQFTNPGTNSFAGQNVLAIVVELDYAAVFNPSGAAVSSNKFAVSATSSRIF